MLTCRECLLDNMTDLFVNGPKNDDNRPKKIGMAGTSEFIDMVDADPSFL